MIIFETLTLRNFLSFGNNTTVINLNTPGTTLILGENLDHTDHGIVSNGSGKSTILNGIVFACYDRIIGDHTKDGLVNHFNKEQMEVSLTFKSDTGTRYKILRQRKMKKSGGDANRTVLYENDVDISTDSTKNIAKQIEDILGMPYEMFVRIIVFSASNDSFLSLPSTSATGPSQKSFVEELFGQKVVSEKADALKLLIKDAKAELEGLKKQVEIRRQEHVRHATLLSSTEMKAAQWEVDREKNVKTWTKQLAVVAEVDIEAEIEAHKALDKVLMNRTSTHNMFVSVQSSLTALVKQRDQYLKTMIQLKDNKCPHCHQAYAKAREELAACEVELESTLQRIEQGEVVAADWKHKVEVLDAEATQIQGTFAVDNLQELLKIQNDVEHIHARIVDLKHTVNPHESTLDDIEASKPAEVDTTEIDKLHQELDHQNILHKLLSSNTSFVRKTLVSKYLPFLNERLSYFTTALGMQHKVSFKEDLSVFIEHKGAEVKFGQLSTGQKARIEFALSMSFKDVRERLHGRFNVCMFDEVLDFGLDAVGVMACAKVIKQMSKTEGVSMFVISHRNEVDSMFDKRLTVQMIKGFSYVVQ